MFAVNMSLNLQWVKTRSTWILACYASPVHESIITISALKFLQCN